MWRTRWNNHGREGFDDEAGGANVVGLVSDARSQALQLPLMDRGSVSADSAKTQARVYGISGRVTRKIPKSIRNLS